jgi:transposase
MLIIGCDFHSRFQQIAMLDTQTGEIVERRLEHGNGEAERFYRPLLHPVRVGSEVDCHLHIPTRSARAPLRN